MSEADSCRADVWLWRARFFKTRSMAAKFVEGGRVRLARAGQESRLDKPARPVRVGDHLVFALGGRLIAVLVLDPRGPELRIGRWHRNSVHAAQMVMTVLPTALLGRFAVDFVTVQDDTGEWRAYAIELNLRKGGTTHPFLTLQFLAGGEYDGDLGTYAGSLWGGYAEMLYLHPRAMLHRVDEGLPVEEIERDSPHEDQQQENRAIEKIQHSGAFVAPDEPGGGECAARSAAGSRLPARWRCTRNLLGCKLRRWSRCPRRALGQSHREG